MIECDDLTRRFGSITAVDHVSFRVANASIFGFLGPNGSGKSTVIRMLCGILKPTSGRARIGGFDVQRYPDAVAGLIGYMSQQFSLYNELSAGEHMKFYGRLSGLGGRELRQRCDELTDMMQLAPYLTRRAAVLSGGWRQRLAMACALVHRPTVLFLDEPTAGIDPVARRQLWDMLFEMAGHGMTLFVTTHYMDEAERCTHVGYINMGRLIVCGIPDDLKKLASVTPAGTRRLDLVCDHLTSALRVARTIPGVRSATMFGQSVRLLVDDAVSSHDIVDALSASNLGEADVRVIAPSLEDVFVTLTEGQRAEASV